MKLVARSRTSLYLYADADVTPGLYLGVDEQLSQQELQLFLAATVISGGKRIAT